MAAANCAKCRHFENSPPALEAALPGLNVLSSAYAAVRASDGLCALHDRYVAATSVCGSITARSALTPARSPSPVSGS